jgi:2-keto-4-pentenoate hydratase/2-oxohepta-3-ene-1,7-dioic acid hydratase in catechol pathway
MKLASFIKDGKATYGGITGERVVDLGPKFGARFPDLKALIAGGAHVGLAPFIETGKDWMPLEVAQFLPVIPNPGKIFCIGVNYADHLKEMGRGVSEHPTIFLRFTDTLVAHGQAAWVPKPTVSTAVDYECELAVIIGKGGRHIAESAALDHVFGYTIFNDGSVRDYQRKTHQWTPGKNFDQTGAIGPVVVTPDELPPGAAGLKIQSRVGTEILQSASTADMMWSVAKTIETLSEYTTLEPGDLIAMGTPPGVGHAKTPPRWLRPGETVEIEIERIGVCASPVMDEVG